MRPPWGGVGEIVFSWNDSRINPHNYDMRAKFGRVEKGRVEKGGGGGGTDRQADTHAHTRARAHIHTHKGTLQLYISKRVGLVYVSIDTRKVWVSTTLF